MGDMDPHPLLDWFAVAQRDLPWRRTYDPYQVWVSEIMLQQTQVKTVLPYFDRFMKRFPTVEDLAEADLDEVFTLWQGLGYYRRARHLWAAAKQVAEHGWPRTQQQWLKLSGVGDYVSSAVASIAFQEDVTLIDGNVRRVMARLLASMEDPRAVLNASLPKGHAREFNQALMELGALVCTPQNPKCASCPLQDQCRAFQRDEVEAFPVPKKRAAIELISVVVALIFNDQGEIFIQKRPDEGLMAGLWEFPGGKVEAGETYEEALRREIQEELGADLQELESFLNLRHAYTRFQVDLRAFTSRLKGGFHTDAPHQWVSISELSNYAFPSANQKLIAALKKSHFSGRMMG